MNDPTESIEEIDCLVESYVEERRAGRCKSIEEFIGRHSRWALQLQELLPAVTFLERSGLTEVIQTKQPLPEIQNYHFSRELGRGGMGIVFQAEHVILGRQVAVKILSASLIQDAKARERFQREARAAARMHHSNIVPVFEVGQCNGTSFYSMQLIVGQNLQQRIRELALLGKSPGRSIDRASHYRQVASLGVSIARALHFAHQSKVLHRDIKPSNILIDGNNTAWLSDFGLAALADETVALSEELAGTLRYLAPERLQGRCDARSDIYSLGLTLYEYITLSPALESLQRSELLNPNRKIPAIRQLDPSIPKDLAIVIEKSIQHEPEARFGSADELADDLQNFLDGRPIAARPASQPKRLWMWSKRNPILATMVLSLNLILLAVAIGSTLIAAKLSGLNQAANDAKSQAIYTEELAQAHAIEAEEQSKIAEGNEKLAKHVSSYFARMIQGADPSGLFTGHQRSLYPIDQSTTAFEWIRQSAKLLESEDFSDQPLVEAELKDTLGIALTGQMKMDDAAPLLKRGLEIRTQNLEPDHPDIAKSLEHLGTYYFYAGDPQAAADYFQEALAIREQQTKKLASEFHGDELIGHSRLETARTQSALGLSVVYSARHANPLAEKLLRESLATRKEILGPEHDEVAYCHVALASILAREGESEQAIEEIQLAEKILIQSQGDHRLTEVFSLYAQGTALQSARLTELAIDRFTRAETMMAELFGPSHPLTVYARGEVAGAWERGGHPEKAEAIYKRVIEFNQKAMPNQPFLGQSWDTLGICYREQNKFPDAILAFENALRIYNESGLPAKHILVAMTKKRLADCLVNIGRIDEAYMLFKEATEALQCLPKDVVDIELATGLSFMSYLALWHQVDKYPEVVEAVVRAGQAETDLRVIEHLMNAGTRGRCTQEQAQTLMAMNERWLAGATDENAQLEANHFRGRILWQSGKYDEAIEVLQGTQRCERRRYQADLFICLCWKDKGDLAKAESLFVQAVNGIMHRLPVRFAASLRDRIGDRITTSPPQEDPPTPIEFHWEQTAYAEFVWRLLHEKSGDESSLNPLPSPVNLLWAGERPTAGGNVGLKTS